MTVTVAPPMVSVIVPAYQSASLLRSCLAGIIASDLPREQFELIVVDDCSNDGTREVAQTMAEIVLTTDAGPRGPAAARNIGALAARGAVLVFIDSDVVIAPTTLSGFVRRFNERAGVHAVFGTYDDAPSDPGFISQYRNLLHRYVHLLHAGDATTFWAGCGAIRRAAFFATGGFDEQRYLRPQIEDIEFGSRLTAAGNRILLAPELTGTHLKRWTLGAMLRTDFSDRAVPWMRLLIEQRSVGGSGPLNLARTEKLFTILAALAAISIVLTGWSREWLWLAVVSLAIIVAGNAKLLAWFGRARGTRFALCVIPMRVLFYLVGGAGAAWATVTHPFQPRRSKQTTLRASTNAADAR